MLIAVLTLPQIAGLLAAALSDLARRIIPNEACMIVAICGLSLRLGHGLAAAAISAGFAALLFLCLVLLHGWRLLGGGDVKLIVACAVGLAPAKLLLLLLAVVMAGGLLAGLYLALRLLPPRRFGKRRPAGWARRVLRVEHWRISRHGSLPYGVAIAAGWLWTFLSV